MVCPPGLGTRRYFLIQRALPQGVFPAARLSVFLQAACLATLVGIVFVLLVAVRWALYVAVNWVTLVCQRAMSYR